MTTEKKEEPKEPKKIEGLLFKLWCSKCRNHTFHLVTEGNPDQTIKCTKCSNITLNQIINEHVKVERGFYNEYNGRKNTRTN